MKPIKVNGSTDHYILSVRWLGDTAFWMGNYATSGIVCVLDRYEGLKFYSGVSLKGSVKSDSEFIAMWGNTFEYDIGLIMFQEVKYWLEDQLGNAPVGSTQWNTLFVKLEDMSE